MNIRHSLDIYGQIHADVIVYIFAHLHTTLHTERNMYVRCKLIPGS